MKTQQPDPLVPRGALRKLEDLAAAYEQKAAAIRLALGELRAVAVDAKRAGGNALVRQAFALDAARRNGHAAAAALVVDPPRRRYDGTHAKRKQDARRRSAAFLRHFSPTTPRPMPAGSADRRRIGGLIRAGYLTTAAGGGKYLRTRKPFAVEQTPKH